MVTIDGTQAECLQALEALHDAAMDYAMAVVAYELSDTDGTVSHDGLVMAELRLCDAAVHWESVVQSSYFNITVV